MNAMMMPPSFQDGGKEIPFPEGMEAEKAAFEAVITKHLNWAKEDPTFEGAYLRGPNDTWPLYLKVIRDDKGVPAAISIHEVDEADQPKGEPPEGAGR